MAILERPYDAACAECTAMRRVVLRTDIVFFLQALCGHDFCRTCYVGCRRKLALCPLCRQRFSTRQAGILVRLSLWMTKTVASVVSLGLPHAERINVQC